MADRPYVVTPEQWKESAIALNAEVDRLDALHADIIDQGRKVQIAASGESKYGAMSAGEYIEWVIGRLGE